MNKNLATRRLVSVLRPVALALSIAGLSGTVLAQTGGDAAYANRVAATRALMAALTRDGGATAREPVTQADGWLREADQHAAKGERDAARALADRAHDTVKTALVRLKSTPSAVAVPSVTAAADAEAVMLAREQSLAQRDIATARVLLDAMRRDPATAGDVPVLAEAVDAAQRELDAGQVHAALTMIEATYGRAKALLAATRKSDGRLSGSASLDADLAAATRQTDTPELREGFVRRQATVQALQAALARINQGQSRHQALLAEGERVLADAARLAHAGRYDEAIVVLDRIYLLLKVGIGELRGGAQVTASKQFANAGEAYAYEQGRNADYAQLIENLIGDSQEHADWRLDAAHARALRVTADSTARSGKWTQALDQIGDSTRVLKRILRDAGFPIL